MKKTMNVFVIAAATSLMTFSIAITAEAKKAPKVEPRVLKRLVEMGQVTSSPFNLPAGGKFDFQFVMNAQMYDVIQNHTGFAINYVQPVAAPIASPLSVGDQKLMKVWSKSVSQAPQGGYSLDSSCLMYMPMAKLSGTVRSFEAKSGIGLSIGFSPAGPLDPGSGSGGGSLSLDIKTAQLDLGVVAVSPMATVSTSTILASAEATAKQTQTNIGLSINFGNFRIGPQFFFQSPLAQVTRKALTNALTDLNAKMQFMPWFTRVIYNHDTHLVVTGGNNVGLKEGDQLAIFNEEHYWQGEPCNSLYIGGFKQNGKTPTAIIELESVGQDISRGRVIQQDSMYNVRLGAKAEILKLVPNTPVK